MAAGGGDQGRASPTDLRGLGLRLAPAAAGAGMTVVAVNVGDLPGRLACIVLAVMFLGPLVLLVISDVREWLGYVPREPGPVGRPSITEWAVAVVFDGASALFVYIGVLEWQAGSVTVLVVSVLIGVIALCLTCGTVGRWWRHRSQRQCSLDR